MAEKVNDIQILTQKITSYLSTIEKQEAEIKKVKEEKAVLESQVEDKTKEIKELNNTINKLKEEKDKEGKE